MSGTTDAMQDLMPTRRHRAPRLTSLRAIWALVLREMSTSYGRSPGGYVWVILEPVLGIALMSLIFGYAFRTPPLGSNYPLFFASGVMILAIYQGLSMKIGMAIPFSRPLLAYPRVSWMDAVLARLLLDMVTQVLVTAILLTGIVLAFGLSLSVDYRWVALALAMAVSLGAGIGLFNAYVMAVFPIWATVWSVMNRPMFIISGVIFLPDAISDPYRSWLYLNPVTHVIAVMRRGLYSSYDAVYASPLYVFIFALIPAVLGLVLLYRRHNDILEL